MKNFRPANETLSIFMNFLPVILVSISKENTIILKLHMFYHSSYIWGAISNICI